MKVCALTIAGFDPSGGAGVLADCQIFARHGVQPLAVITALTAQDSRGVYGVQALDAQQIEKQIKRLFQDFPIRAVKTGLLPNRKVIEAISKSLPKGIPLVIDPVLASSGGFRFLNQDGIEALKELLFPKATLITPNLEEAAKLFKTKNFNAKTVLIKGGHEKGRHSIDRLYDEQGMKEYSLPRISGPSVHGTGCALSAAIAAQLALKKPLREAITIAKKDLHRRILKAKKIGKGRPFLDFDL